MVAKVRESRVNYLEFCCEFMWHWGPQTLLQLIYLWKMDSLQAELSGQGEMQNPSLYLMTGDMEIVVDSRQPYHSSLFTWDV